jgi:DNA-binding transcriptional LysR family regulator
LASLVTASETVTPEILAGFNAVLPARGTVTRTILLDALQPFDVKVETSLETNYLETIKMMVSVGLGWSALPSKMIDDGITAVPVEGLTMQRQLGSVCLQGRTLSRAAVAFLDLLPAVDRNCKPGDMH